MAKAPTAPGNKAVAIKNDQLPAYLQDQYGKGSGLQGLDAADFVVPRVKLLQGISPEVEAHENAKAGIYWLTVLDIPLGESLDFIPINNRKRYLLLPPLGDDRGVLARAEDGVHWKPSEGEWQIKLKNVRQPVTWKIDAPTVRESGLAEFGSSNPDDPDSNPAATLFYDYLVYLPDFPEYSPCLISLARSAAKRARDLHGKIEMRKVPMQGQRFRTVPTKEVGAEGDYLNWQFLSSGFATEDEFTLCSGLRERFGNNYRSDDEGVDREDRADKSGGDAKEY